MNRNQYELYHYGIKGMKWGRRKKRDSKNAHNKNYTDKQRKNDRAFYGEKGEKRINKKLNEGYGLRGARHFEAERRQRVEKRKKSAEYKAEKKRHSDYQYMRNNYTTNYGMTKAARGKQMQKLGISADKPVGTLKTSKAIKENAKAMAKQYSKVAVGYAVATGAAYVGAKYLNSRMNMNVDTSKLPRLETGNIINLKPHQYKVS